MFSANASQVSNDVKYIEDFCSVYLRTGTGASQTVTTGVKENTGALVISKSRSAATDWAWYDTFRGATYDLVSNSTAAQTTQSQGLTAFNADGHTWGTLAKINTSGATYVDTVLKPTPKFFDVVTYTGTGSAQTIAHNLGSVPGCIIVKVTSSSNDWAVYHRGLNGGTTPENYRIFLNATTAQGANSAYWNNTQPTSTQFTVGSNGSVNGSGSTYVAYLFAHDAGGFGLTGTDNVISCGSFTTNGSGNATVNLGYEPQWVLFKPSSTTGEWTLLDTMRGWVADGTNADKLLYANKSDAEVGAYNMGITATGFDTRANLGASQTHIYIAIRRGPMKVPTSGTSVLQTLTYTGNGSAGRIYSGVTTVPDLAIATSRSNTSPKNWCDRLRGENPMISTSTDGESGTSQEGKTIIAGSANGTVTFGSYWGDAAVNTNGYTYVNYLLSRAPSFMDVVCYTGTGVTHTETHNLGVAPELIIVKRRASATASWAVYAAPLTASYVGFLDLTNAFQADNMWNSTAPTSTAFTVRAANAQVNASGSTYVAYLFATCAGVSKVGSYTGTGASGNAITTGFSPRFLMIKCTSTTGNWIVFDTARGMGAGSDPYLLLNTTGAEVTGTDWLDVSSSGFSLNTTGNATNGSGQTYIYLAIA